MSKTADWSSRIVPGTTIDDLSPEAILSARKGFSRRFPFDSVVADSWNDATFIEKMQLSENGEMKVAAIILLGKSSLTISSGSNAFSIKWYAKNRSGLNKNVEIFSSPAIFAGDKILSLIHNPKYSLVGMNKELPQDAPVYAYDDIREAVNNCIAHTCYAENGEISITEYENFRIEFRNAAAKFPESIEKAVISANHDSEPENPLLFRTMEKFGMISGNSSGIKRMFQNHCDRRFPLPEYKFSKGFVTLTMTGRILNERYVRILDTKMGALTLREIILLDKVQKGVPLKVRERAALEKKHLLSESGNETYGTGHTAKTRLSALRHTGMTGENGHTTPYMTKRVFDDDSYFKKIIVENIKANGPATRKAIDTMIRPRLSEELTDRQKYKKIDNIILDLHRNDDCIEYDRNTRTWRLTQN